MNAQVALWRNTFEAEVCSPNLVLFYESLPVKAPTMKVQPYCCYDRRIIFYELPYRIERGVYARYDETETQWSLLGQRWTDEDIGFAAAAPFVEHEGVVYELTSGQVRLRCGQWVMQWRARRVRDSDVRLVTLRRLLGEVPE